MFLLPFPQRSGNLLLSVLLFLSLLLFGVIVSRPFGALILCLNSRLAPPIAVVSSPFGAKEDHCFFWRASLSASADTVWMLDYFNNSLLCSRPHPQPLSKGEVRGMYINILNSSYAEGAV
jgi:hypothetical protein